MQIELLQPELEHGPSGGVLTFGSMDSNSSTSLWCFMLSVPPTQLKQKIQHITIALAFAMQMKTFGLSIIMT